MEFLELGRRVYISCSKGHYQALGWILRLRLSLGKLPYF